MPRPKTGKAYEVLNCRVPPGLIARINAHAELYSQRVRDVVAEALLAYLDGTQVAPSENQRRAKWYARPSNASAKWPGCSALCRPLVGLRPGRQRPA